MNPALDQVALYSVSTVSALCGVDVATLRNWELRYGLLQPQRDTNGHRVYSEQDVERVRNIIALLDQGVPVDHIAAMLDQEDAADRPQVSRRNAWDQLRLRMRTAIGDFDESGLQALYSEALAQYPMRCVLERAILPLMRDLGARWRGQPGAVAEEHFFTFFLRNKLGARFHHHSAPAYGPKLLAACMPGEQHDLGLLLFVFAALERGYRVTVLGPDTPFSDLAFAARRISAHAVILSASLEPGPVLFNKLLPDFIAQLHVPVCIGGTLSESQRERLERAGGVPVGADSEGALARIGGLLAERD